MVHAYSELDPVIGGPHTAATLARCAEHGAIILSSHGHTYRRFYPYPLTENRHPHRSKMKVFTNHTTHIICGLGGDSIHEALTPAGLVVNFGFVACEFNLYPTMSDSDGNFYEAQCEFVTINDEIVDEWTMRVPIPPENTL
jgi:hypothetical protein